MISWHVVHGMATFTFSTERQLITSPPELFKYFMELVCRKIRCTHWLGQRNSEKLGMFFSFHLLINLATASQLQRLSQTSNNKNAILSRTEYGISNNVVVADINLLLQFFDKLITALTSNRNSK